MTPGFLLTRQWQDTPQGVRLDLWFSTEQGPLAVSVHQQHPIFFIRQGDASEVESVLQDLPGITFKPLELKTFKQEKVVGVYFKSQQQLYRARDLLTNHALPCYESDIRPTERYLTERFITGAVIVEADYQKQRLDNAKIKPSNYVPNLSIMSIDIESDFETEQIFSISFVSTDQKRTLIIGNGENSERIEYCADEANLLKRWVEWVEAIDPDIFIGWNVVNFDFRLIQKRAQVLRIALQLGRDKSIPS
ncbi:MAG: DNA polymerase II, partial [Gammaproteobacteria bacterium]|nr:DNA polymerase II [Gammaproteobacteria bacterium]